MRTRTHVVRTRELAVRRVGSSLWILRPLRALAREAVPALRDSFDEAIEHDATDVVVDVGTVAISAEGAATLMAMADSMRSRQGSLWIAAAWPDGTGFTLQQIREPAPAGLTGISRALDEALDEALDIDVEVYLPGRHNAPAVA